MKNKKKVPLFSLFYIFCFLLTSALQALPPMWEEGSAGNRRGMTSRGDQEISALQISDKQVKESLSSFEPREEIGNWELGESKSAEQPITGEEFKSDITENKEEERIQLLNQESLSELSDFLAQKKTLDSQVLVSPEKISSRRYMLLKSKEFEAIAGPKSRYSPEYTLIMKELDRYQDNQDADLKGKIEQLKILQDLILHYRTKEENRRKILLRNHKMAEKEIASIERLYQRVKACSLLERGIEVEKYRLVGESLPSLMREENLLPRRGILFYPEEMLEFKNHYASGMMSLVSKIKHARYDQSFIYKEENPLSELTQLQAKQLGFSEEAQEIGVSKKAANLAGRSLATYKINELMEAHLVPKVRHASLTLGFGDPLKIGCVQDMIDNGVQLVKDETIPVTQQRVEEFFTMGYGEESSPGVGYYCPPSWQLCFNKNLFQASQEQPLLKNGIPIEKEQALALVEQGLLSYEEKKLFSVDDTIDFKDPLLQKRMANIQLLHLITGEVDPNPTNFIYVREPDKGWNVYAIDADLSFSSSFTFPDYSQFKGTLEELRKDMNSKLEVIAETLNPKFILKEMPLLIDETMGEAVLNLTAEDVVRALQETALQEKEVKATINRLLAVQKYCQAMKDEGRFVRDGVEEVESETAAATNERDFLTWGEATYNIAAANSTSSYLGRTLEDQKGMRMDLEQELIQRRKELEEAGSRTSEEEEELAHLLERLQRLQNLPEPMRVEHHNRIRTSDLEMGDSRDSMVTTCSKKSNYTIFSFISDASSWGHRNQARAGKPTDQRFLASLLTRQLPPAVRELLHASNEAYMEARGKTKKANSSLVQARTKTSINASFQELSDSWQETIKQLTAAQQAWEKAITAYKKEQSYFKEHFKNHRQENLQKSKEHYDKTLLDLLWAQVHQTESAISIALEEAQADSVSTSTAAATANLFYPQINKQLIKGREAWSRIMSEGEKYSFFRENGRYRFPEKWCVSVWKDNFNFTNSIQRCSKFFSCWREMAKDFCRGGGVFYDFYELQSFMNSKKFGEEFGGLGDSNDRDQKSLLLELEPAKPAPSYERAFSDSNLEGKYTSVLFVCDRAFHSWKLPQRRAWWLPIEESNNQVQEKVLAELAFLEKYLPVRQMAANVTVWEDKINRMARRLIEYHRGNFYDHCYIDGVNEHLLEKCTFAWDSLAGKRRSLQQVSNAFLQEFGNVLFEEDWFHTKSIAGVLSCLDDGAFVGCLYLAEEQMRKSIDDGKKITQQLANSLSSEDSIELINQAISSFSRARSLGTYLFMFRREPSRRLWRPNFPEEYFAERVHIKIKIKPLRNWRELGIEPPEEPSKYRTVCINSHTEVPMNRFMDQIDSYPRALKFRNTLQDMTKEKFNPFYHQWSDVRDEIEILQMEADQCLQEVLRKKEELSSNY